MRPVLRDVRLDIDNDGFGRGANDGDVFSGSGEADQAWGLHDVVNFGRDGKKACLF